MNKVSGVYQIQSKIKPERIYIGSAIDIDWRCYIHFWELLHNKHHSQKLQNHYNKYGKDDLVFLVLCTCEENQLLQIEQYFLDFYHPYFNIRIKAESNLGIKMSKEFCKKRSYYTRGSKNPMYGTCRIGKDSPMYEKHHSEETRKILSCKMLGNKNKIGRHVSDESLQRMIKAQRLRYSFPQTKIKSWIKAKGKLPYIGVCYSEDHIRARITFRGKRIHLGYFIVAEEAAKAYDKKAKELFGEFANLNFR